jgi:predicted negative regulator of RcsB-dependent stress response
MRKKIIGIILLVLIVFGGYKLFANVSANNVNSNSIQFSYEDIPASVNTRYVPSVPLPSCFHKA